MSAFSVVGFGKYDMPDVRDLPIGQAGNTPRDAGGDVGFAD